MLNIYNTYIFNLNYLNFIEILLVSIIFLSIGSFAAATISRLNPKNKKNDINLLFPRSFCPTCKKPIDVLHLIPIIGYLLQRGSCSSCNSNISIFYPITEIFFLTIGIILLGFYGASINLAFLILILYLFYALFFLDLRYYFLPFSLNLALIFTGIISNSVFGLFIDEYLLFYFKTPILFSFFGIFFGYISLWIINFIFKLIYKKDGIGGGDFILFAGIGSIFGPFSLSYIVFFGSMIGCLYYVFFKGFSGDKLPFGSFLILGSCLYFFIKTSELLSKLIVI